MTVLLVNPNGSARTSATMCAIVGTVLPDVSVWTAAGGPSMIVDDTQLAAAARQVAGMALPGGLRGIIVAAFGDPGRDALAMRAGVPVVGIGAAAARAASTRETFAVVTTTPGLQGSIDALMRTHCGAATYLGCRLTVGDPLDLASNDAALEAALLAATQLAAEEGARAVIIGGGPLGAAASRIAPRTRVPLIAPLLCAAMELREALTGA